MQGHAGKRPEAESSGKDEEERVPLEHESES
jgi:hypothetical protein